MLRTTIRQAKWLLENGKATKGIARCATGIDKSGKIEFNHVSDGWEIFCPSIRRTFAATPNEIITIVNEAENQSVLIATVFVLNRYFDSPRRDLFLTYEIETAKNMTPKEYINKLYDNGQIDANYRHELLTIYK